MLQISVIRLLGTEHRGLLYLREFRRSEISAAEQDVAVYFALQILFAALFRRPRIQYIPGGRLPFWAVPWSAGWCL